MVRAALFGVGEAASAVARYALAKNIEIVAAFSRTSGVGRDLGDFMELGRPLGVSISNDPAATLAGCTADIALMATQSTLSSQLELIRVSLEHGLDVLSLAEEGFHPPNFGDHEVAGRIESLALDAGRTVFFGGVQDVFWYEALLALTGAANRIETIRGFTVSDLEDLGPKTLGTYPLGLSAKEFDAFLETPDADEYALDTMGVAVSAVLATLGMAEASRELRIEPVFAETDIHCAVLDSTIPAGTTCGVSEVLAVSTTNGVEVRTEFISTLFTEGQTPQVRWEIHGEPDLEVMFDRFPGYEVTASNLINRIPTVIAASAGYRSVADLPAPRYWAGVEPASRS